MTDFPQGATKGVETSTLNWLKGMPFQDVEELTEWLLDTPGEDPIRPRTHSEMMVETQKYLNEKRERRANQT